jgi:preprotein translocase subunit YajC
MANKTVTKIAIILMIIFSPIIAPIYIMLTPFFILLRPKIKKKKKLNNQNELP